jgi:bacteriorhodopsin
MQTASFTGFIKMIFEIIIFYYIVKFLAKLFLPMLVKKAVQKAGEKFQQNQEFNSNQANNEEVIINSKTDKPRETKKVGEYVDFEEID